MIIPVLGTFDYEWLTFIIRYLHVVSAVMWIGLLWYLNFVQMFAAPAMPAELRPAIGGHILPRVLFWFRWGAMFTLIFGLLLSIMNGYFSDAVIIGLGSGVAKHAAIGIGMWLGTIMWFNVWFVIWPAQKIVMGQVEADDAGKAAAARRAMLFSRANTLMSIPMLYAMIAAQNIY